jgi:hypothetical protein
MVEAARGLRGMDAAKIDEWPPIRLRIFGSSELRAAAR